MSHQKRNNIEYSSSATATKERLLHEPLQTDLNKSSSNTNQKSFASSGNSNPRLCLADPFQNNECLNSPVRKIASSSHKNMKKKKTKLIEEDSSLPSKNFNILLEEDKQQNKQLILKADENYLKKRLIQDYSNETNLADPEIPNKDKYALRSKDSTNKKQNQLIQQLENQSSQKKKNRRGSFEKDETPKSRKKFVQKSKSKKDDFLVKFLESPVSKENQEYIENKIEIQNSKGSSKGKIKSLENIIELKEKNHAESLETVNQMKKKNVELNQDYEDNKIYKKKILQSKIAKVLKPNKIHVQKKSKQLANKLMKNQSTRLLLNRRNSKEPFGRKPIPSSDENPRTNLENDKIKQILRNKSKNKTINSKLQREKAAAPSKNLALALGSLHTNKFKRANLNSLLKQEKTEGNSNKIQPKAYRNRENKHGSYHEPNAQSLENEKKVLLQAQEILKNQINTLTKEVNTHKKHVEKISIFKEKIKELEKNCNQLQTEKLTSEKEKNYYKQNWEISKTKIDTLENEMKNTLKLQASLNNQLNKLIELSSENDRLKEMISILQREKQDLKKEHEKLLTSFHNDSSLMKTSTELVKQLMRAKEDIELSHSKMAKLESEKLSLNDMYNLLQIKYNELAQKTNLENKIAENFINNSNAKPNQAENKSLTENHIIVNQAQNNMGNQLILYKESESNEKKYSNGKELINSQEILSIKHCNNNQNQIVEEKFVDNKFVDFRIKPENNSHISIVEEHPAKKDFSNAMIIADSENQPPNLITKDYAPQIIFDFIEKNKILEEKNIQFQNEIFSLKNNLSKYQMQLFELQDLKINLELNGQSLSQTIKNQEKMVEKLTNEIECLNSEISNLKSEVNNSVGTAAKPYCLQGEGEASQIKNSIINALNVINSYKPPLEIKKNKIFDELFIFEYENFIKNQYKKINITFVKFEKISEYEYNLFFRIENNTNQDFSDIYIEAFQNQQDMLNRTSRMAVASKISKIYIGEALEVNFVVNIDQSSSQIFTNAFRGINGGQFQLAQSCQIIFIDSSKN